MHVQEFCTKAPEVKKNKMKPGEELALTKNTNFCIVCNLCIKSIIYII